MKINIISKDQNPLMKRREVKFSVDHSDVGGTPSRLEVSKQLASLLKTKVELVFVQNLETKTGTMVTVGEANVYDSVEQAKFMEPKHMIARNALPEKAEEPKEEKPQAKEEQPEEEKEETKEEEA
jgi:small subunit ribosomal protein S24e